MAWFVVSYTRIDNSDSLRKELLSQTGTWLIIRLLFEVCRPLITHSPLRGVELFWGKIMKGNIQKRPCFFFFFFNDFLNFICILHIEKT